MDHTQSINHFHSPHTHTITIARTQTRTCQVRYSRIYQFFLRRKKSIPELQYILVDFKEGLAKYADYIVTTPQLVRIL